ncbi:MAG: surfeit locus 1 family protein [Alphaproteobacteria bacterium]|jgi:surfeit locus 1 family protein
MFHNLLLSYNDKEINHYRDTMRQKITLSLFFIPIIILGIVLALWQYQRSQWKQQILADYQGRIFQDALPLPASVMRTKGDEKTIYGHNSDLFQAHDLTPIQITGSFRNDLIFYRPAGDGIELITAFETSEGIIAVNAGKMPYVAKTIAIDTILPKGRLTITGFYRIAKPYGAVLPSNQDLVASIPFGAFFQQYKEKTLSGALQINDKIPISDYLKGRSGTYFMDNIPNNHIQYMGTWFLLSGIAFIIYILLLRKTKIL